jgi:hypothetical protein
LPSFVVAAARRSSILDFKLSASSTCAWYFESFRRSRSAASRAFSYSSHAACSAAIALLTSSERSNVRTVWRTAPLSATYSRLCTARATATAARAGGTACTSAAG